MDYRWTVILTTGRSSMDILTNQPEDHQATKIKMSKKTVMKILLPLAFIILVFSNSQLDTWLFGEARGKKEIIPASTILVPTNRTILWQSSSAYADSLIRSRGKEPFGSWSFEKKVTLPRTILAHLLAGQNIRETNHQIMNLKPWGKSGSKWLLNSNGGYDFPLTTLTTILYLFDTKPEVLYPEAKKHLNEVLLNDEGEGFSDAVPGSLGRIKDSENHILMAQGSKYLKNRYLMLHGNMEDKFNNEHNGMEAGILDNMKELSEMGLYEFNSVPYLGFTLAALLNLEAFGSEKVQKASREVLDYLSFSYALGSYKFKYYPPFRRRYEQAKNKMLSKDYQTVFMKTWLSFHPVIKYNEGNETGESHALIAACMPYRPADEVVNLIYNKTPGYFVKLGHGSKSSPEIYSAGPGFLLSAGGVNRGKWSIIVARPISLFLDDDATELSGVFHLSGPGKDYMKWNNTGVWKNFACAAGPVSVPNGFKPVAVNETWNIFQTKDSLLIAVHFTPGLGIMAIFENQNPQELVKKLMEANPDPEILKSQFRFPSGSKIDFDVEAPKDKWVIKSVDGKPLDRDFDRWPLICGN
jgi:hypothetical protein